MGIAKCSRQRVRPPMFFISKRSVLIIVANMLSFIAFYFGICCQCVKMSLKSSNGSNERERTGTGEEIEKKVFYIITCTNGAERGREIIKTQGTYSNVQVS